MNGEESHKITWDDIEPGDVVYWREGDYISVFLSKVARGPYQVEFTIVSGGKDSSLIDIMRHKTSPCSGTIINERRQ